MQNKIHIELTYKGTSCLPSVHMEEAVRDILPAYDRQVTYSRLDIRSQAGKQRFLTLSCSLFGEKGVYEHHRLAPIPALFMDGKLVFDVIPSRDELEDAIDERQSPDPQVRRRERTKPRRTDTRATEDTNQNRRGRPCACRRLTLYADKPHSTLDVRCSFEPIFLCVLGVDFRTTI